MSWKQVAMLSFLVGAAVGRPVLAQEVPAKIASFLELCERSRRGATVELEHKLRGLRGQGTATPETSDQIARLEEQLRVLRSNAKPVVSQIAFPPQVGAIGRLPGLVCHVDQLVSADEFLARCYFPVVVRTVKNFSPRRETVVQGVRFLVRGMATQAVREGNDLEMLDVFEITGKHKYKNASGAWEEVLVLTVFDMKAVEPYFRKMAEQQR